MGGFDQVLPSNSESAAPRHFSAMPRSSNLSILTCITGVFSFLISPISPKVTRFENPARWKRGEVRCWKAARAVRGRKKNSPAVITRIASDTKIATAAKRSDRPRADVRATVLRLCRDWRISPLANVATPRIKKNNRKMKKLTRSERTQAANNSRNAMILSRK